MVMSFTLLDPRVNLSVCFPMTDIHLKPIKAFNFFAIDSIPLYWWDWTIGGSIFGAREILEDHNEFQYFLFGINTKKYAKSPPNVTVALVELLKNKLIITIL